MKMPPSDYQGITTLSIQVATRIITQLSFRE